MIESKIVEGKRTELISTIPLGGVALSSKNAIINSIKSFLRI